MSSMGGMMALVDEWRCFGGWQRVFMVDVLRCPCGGRRRVLSMIFSQASIERVLTALGLPCEVEPRAPPAPVQGVLGFGG